MELTSKTIILTLFLGLLAPTRPKHQAIVMETIACSHMCIENTPRGSFSIFARCSLSGALWDHATGKCWNPKLSKIFNNAVFSTSGGLLSGSKSSTSCGGYYIFTDLTLALLPISIIWRLSVALQRRVALSVLLGFAVLWVACGRSQNPHSSRAQPVQSYSREQKAQDVPRTCKVDRSRRNAAWSNPTVPCWQRLLEIMFDEETTWLWNMEVQWV